MQTPINIVLGVAVLALGAALFLSNLDQAEPGPGQGEIQAMVDAAVAERMAEIESSPSPGMDTAALDERIEAYLLANPRLLERMSSALESELRAEEGEMARLALAEMQADIYEDPDNIVLGNPEGDVTLVEMFDYNCGYCRQVVPDILALIEEDPDLRVILREFPILSQGSIDAARIGVLVNRDQDADYIDYHTTLFAARGAIDLDAALSAAESVGLNPVLAELDMNADDVTQTIQRSYAIAQGLGVSGTPTFIIGEEVIAGAVPKAELSRRIANMRECGQTNCG